jgi:DivIVA domain-containing protein
MKEEPTMTPDRESIVRRDFPLGRRGYDVDAVDAHLAAIADELEREEAEAQAAAPEQEVSLDQVRAIVEAAERSGAELQRTAKERAAATRAAVERDREQALQQADAEADAHVTFVSAAAAAMLERVEAVERELEGLLQTLRAGARRLEADLSGLERRVGELSAAARRPAPAPGAAQADSTSEAHEPVGPQDANRAAEPAADEAVQPAAAGSVQEAADEPAEGAAEDAAPAADDIAGARLIALNMALTGASLEDTDRYLAENFDLPERAKLLREVYDSVQR